jgi:RNA polymerase sigma factor (sigma-70 family)
MGFLASSARNLALEHARRRRGPRALSIEELPTADIPAPGDEARQQVAVLIARRAIDSFPATLRKQMFRHYVDGCSWAEIAEEFAASEDTVKKNVSRALIKVSDAILAGETEATKGAEGRVVRWLKEMLPRIPVRL